MCHNLPNFHLVKTGLIAVILPLKNTNDTTDKLINSFKRMFKIYAICKIKSIFLDVFNDKIFMLILFLYLFSIKICICKHSQSIILSIRYLKKLIYILKFNKKNISNETYFASKEYMYYISIT